MKMRIQVNETTSEDIIELAEILDIKLCDWQVNLINSVFNDYGIVVVAIPPNPTRRDLLDIIRSAVKTAQSE